MGRKRCVRAIARTAVTVALVAVVFVILGESRPARAGWFEYGLNGAPMCPPAGGGFGGCPTLELSCQSASYQYYDVPVLAIRIIDSYSAECLLPAIGGFGYFWVYTENTCPNGYSRVSWADSGCFPAGLFEKQPCVDDCSANNDAPSFVGNPIETGSGRKVQQVVDFTTGGPNALSFARTYNSLLSDYYNGSNANKSLVGGLWRSNFHAPQVIWLSS